MDKEKRDFLKWSLITGTAVALTPIKNALPAASNKKVKLPASKLPDLVGVKDGSPAQMFDIGIKALGGMKRFVKKGQTVLVKPNIGWNKTPTEGANTNPDLVARIIKSAYEAGAKKVVVFDHTCNDMDDSYKNSGMEKAVKASGGFLYPADKKKYYRKVDIKGAKTLKEAHVHNLFLDSDVVINVPVLKHHMGARMTSAIKNFMGVVWDRRYWHRNNLHECIADFPLIRKVELTVIDAYLVMMKNGPRGISSDDLNLKKMQILSTDMVLADTAAAKILNQNPANIPYLKMAQSHGYGSMNLKKSKIKRLSAKS